MNNVINKTEYKEIIEKHVQNIDTIETIFPHITERRANLAMVGVNARTYIHWRNLGLVGEQSGEDEPRVWVRLNLFDYVWLKIVKLLREFGVPLETIKALREYLEVDIIKGVEKHYKEYIKYLREESKIPPEKIQDQIDIINVLLHNKNEIPTEEKHVTSVLGSLIYRSLLCNDQAYIIVYKEKDVFSFGSYTFQTMEEYTEEVSKWLQYPHLNIPLNGLIGEFMEEPKNEPNLEVWGFINKNERKVLEAIRNKNFKEINIKKNGKKESLILEEINDGDITEHKAKEIRRILGLNQYSEITLTYRNDKSIYFKNKKRL